MTSTRGMSDQGTHIQKISDQAAADWGICEQAGSPAVMAPTCLLPTDIRMFRDTAGGVHSTHSAGHYRNWLPYVRIFSAVEVLARMSSTESTDSGPADGPGVSVLTLADYHGPVQFVRHLPATAARIWQIPLDNCLPVVRLPEPISMLLAMRCRLGRRPYVAMVVADVKTMAPMYFPRRYRGLSRALGRLTSSVVARLVRGAAGTIYVTQANLQRSYPSQPGAAQLIRSNVTLSFDDIAHPRGFPLTTRRLISVGSQQSDAKGHDVAIRALRRLRDDDPRYRLVLVGSGRLQAELRRLAGRIGVAEHVEFTGELGTTTLVREKLDAADLFLMPSRSEGLPRALIEAMAAGLPAVGTSVGGIPELITPPWLVEPGDAEGLAFAVQRMFARPADWIAMSEHGVTTARRIAESTDMHRLEEFFHRVLSEWTRDPGIAPDSTVR